LNSQLESEKINETNAYRSLYIYIVKCEAKKRYIGIKEAFNIESLQIFIIQYEISVSKYNILFFLIT